MDWVDLVLLGYLVLGALYGLRRGLVWVGFSLLGYIAGAIVAAHMYKRVTAVLVSAVPLRHWVERYLPAPASAIPGARLQAWHMAHTLIGLVIFLLIIGALEFVGRTIGSVISQGVSSFRPTAVINRVGGIVAGLAEHGAVAGLILTMLLAVPALSHSGLSRAVQQAPVAGTLMGLFGHIAKIPGGQYL